jgi:murein DD-endopeptidase MepM/ murein hydrolase activator NlpD
MMTRTGRGWRIVPQGRLASCVVTSALVAGCGGGHGPVQPSAAPLDATVARCTQDFGDPAVSLYQLPFPAGRSYELFQGYCPPDPRWGHNGWLAYDFDLAIGDTIVASRAGTVIFVEQRWPDSDRVCGHENAVYVLHADGTVLAYVHLTTNGALVRSGDPVAAGQPIGRSGDSGCSSGPHLHVALFRDRTSYTKENTLPLNYHDADGPLDARRGLVQGARYSVRRTQSSSPTTDVQVAGGWGRGTSG